MANDLYHPCTRSVSLIAIVASMYIVSIIGLCDGELWMTKNTFSLDTVVSRFWMSEIEAQLQVRERYSHDQLRARIDYDSGWVSAKKKNKKRATYYDVNQKAMVTLESRGNNQYCTALEVSSIFTELHKSNLHMDFGLYMFERLLTTDHESHDWQHIVGPARLLIWVEQNFHKFNRSDSNLPLNNIPVELFSYSTSSQESIEVGVPFHLKLYYRVGESRDNIKIPSSVVINAAEQSSYGFIYEYTLESLQKYPAQTSANVHEANGGDIIEDEFTFPINLRCSQEMKKVGRIFESDNRLDRVSFRASITSTFEGLQQSTKTILKEQVVSFYKPLESIRIETTHKDATKFIELINFKTQSHYHIQLGRAAASRLGSVDLGQRSRSCMSLQPTPLKISNGDKDIEEFLLGPNEYALMGRGIVRGIDVLIYETTGGQLPYWIERPTSYTDRRNANNVQTSDEKVNIVIYVSDSSHQDRRYLVQMDVYRSKSETQIGALHRSIKFHDFVWSFNYRMMEDLFSLHDHCLATGESDAGDVSGTDTTQSVFVVDKVDRVNMLLGSVADEAQQSYEWLRDAIRRNLALRVAMQNDLDLPATSVMDLQSKVIIQQPSNSAATIHVSFSQLRRSRPTVLKPIFLGTITIKIVHEDGSSLIGDCMSFQECLFEAADKGANKLQFNYDSSSGRCWIRRVPLKNELLGSSDPIDVFGFEFVEVQNVKEISWSHGSERLKSLDKKIKLIDQENYRDISLFHLRDVHAEKDTDFRTINSDYQVDVDSFQGFGLTEADRRNWRIRPQKVFINDEASPLAMDPATCKQACLQDFHCKSYSLCMDRRGELVCTLSEASFRPPKVVEQLSVSSARRNRNFASLTVYLDPIDTIVLEKSSRCELHNKLYSQLFEKSGEVRTKSAGKHVYAVDSREDCAQICLNRTNKILSESDYETRSDISLQKLVEKRRDVCAHFYYIDRIQFEALSDEITNDFNTKLETSFDYYEGVNGYCMMEAGRTSSSFQKTKASSGRGFDPSSGALFEYFVFDFETLFDKAYGVSLKSVALNQKQLESYSLLTQARGKDKMLRDPRKQETYEEAAKMMDFFMEQGNNIQSSLRVANIRRCAKKCILEAGLVWPICKSFDIKVEKDPSSDENILVCYLNSMTLSEIRSAERFDLIDRSADQAREMWHYEPLLSTIRLMTGSESDDFDADDVILDDELNSFIKLQQPDSVTTFGRFSLIAIGVISGLVLGVKSATRFRNKYSQRAEDRIRFASRRATVDFVNQVNSEGKIPA